MYDNVCLSYYAKAGLLDFCLNSSDIFDIFRDQHSQGGIVSPQAKERICIISTEIKCSMLQS